MIEILTASFFFSGSVENVAKGPVSAIRSFSFMQGLPPITCEALRLGGHERDIFNRAPTISTFLNHPSFLWLKWESKKEYHM
jgi:hypothetical protein